MPTGEEKIQYKERDDDKHQMIKKNKKLTSSERLVERVSHRPKRD